MTRAQQCAEQARAREQERQARYYDRNVRSRREFKTSDRVWLYNPPRGPKATKFVHQWMGPMRILEPVGYDNFRLKREDQMGVPEEMIAHLRYEEAEQHDATAAASIRTATAVENRTTSTGSIKRNRTATGGTTSEAHTSGQLVECKRRRRRNKGGHYVLEYQLTPVGDPKQWTTDDKGKWTTEDGHPRSRWITLDEYERYHAAGRVVEDP
eukprot:jgi/Phyca11/133014/e_gw1.294.2.1